jgi:hypothetical protein
VTIYCFSLTTSTHLICFTQIPITNLSVLSIRLSRIFRTPKIFLVSLAFVPIHQPFFNGFNAYKLSCLSTDPLTNSAQHLQLIFPQQWRSNNITTLLNPFIFAVDIHPYYAAPAWRSSLQNISDPTAPCFSFQSSDWGRIRILLLGCYQVWGDKHFSRNPRSNHTQLR